MADVFNTVSGLMPDDIIVLFENLWWPGLRLRDNAITELFFSKITKRNVGIMLDTGHLLNTDDRVTSEDDATDFIYRTVNDMGEMKNLIKGIYLSCSLSAAYGKNLPKVFPENHGVDVLMKHVSNIDRHKPFSSKKVQNILSLVQHDYLVHELSYRSLADLEIVLHSQLQACSKI